MPKNQSGTFREVRFGDRVDRKVEDLEVA